MKYTVDPVIMTCKATGVDCWSEKQIRLNLLFNLTAGFQCSYKLPLDDSVTFILDYVVNTVMNLRVP
jgi:hypothetical protein